MCWEGVRQYLIKSKTNRGKDWVKEQEEEDGEAEDRNVDERESGREEGEKN